MLITSSQICISLSLRKKCPLFPIFLGGGRVSTQFLSRLMRIYEAIKLEMAVATPIRTCQILAFFPPSKYWRLFFFFRLGEKRMSNEALRRVMDESDPSPPLPSPPPSIIDSRTIFTALSFSCKHGRLGTASPLFMSSIFLSGDHHWCAKRFYALVLYWEE